MGRFGKLHNYPKDLRSDINLANCRSFRPDQVVARYAKRNLHCVTVQPSIFTVQPLLHKTASAVLRCWKRWVHKGVGVGRSYFCP